MPSRRSRKIFGFLRFIEHHTAIALGKGYGADTVRREVQMVQTFFDRAPRLAIDIGAHVGAYTAELRARNPDLEIHAFEPAAVNVSQLEKRFRNDASISIVPAAVSKASGRTTLYSPAPGSELASLSKRRLLHFDIPFACAEDVRVLRFEDYWSRSLGGRTVDLVKLDIEGHELAALEGFGNALRSVRVLQFEFGGCNIDSRTYFQDFWYLLSDQGFAIFRVTPFGCQHIEAYEESDEVFLTTNFIAANASVLV